MNPPPIPAQSEKFRPGRRVKTVVTPEGTPLELAVASFGDRASAFAIDCLVLGGVFILLSVVAILTPGAVLPWSVTGALLILIFFLLRNFYFTWHELRRNGTTPGKRRLGLQVVDAGGGPLTSEAVLARNFMREIEFWLPMQVLLRIGDMFPGAPGYVAFGSVLWILFLTLMPLFNADRRRVGDLVAGTMVVIVPKSFLAADLGTQANPVMRVAQRTRHYEFTPEQLGYYGVFELEKLEEILRRRSRDRRETLQAVCEKIKTKIGWENARWDVQPEVFLRDFYEAQRAHLERNMLFGKRKDHKG